MKIKRIDDFETTLKIGYQGENLARCFEWDLREWVAEFGEGTPTLLVQRSGDPAAYPVSITFEDNVLRWTPTSADTAQTGVGELQLRYTVSEIVVKERVMSVVVKDSLDDGETPPAPWSGWVDEVIRAKADAESARDQAQDAQGLAEAAQTAAETAQGNAERDAGRAEMQATIAVRASADARSARNAALDAQTAAETAQGKAETAQSAAETAQGKAEDAERNANIAADAAEEHKNAAETAQSKAEDAQSAAETAQGKAEDAQTAAEEAAAVSAANQYIAFATDGVSDALAFHTALGADGIPLKSATVTHTAGSVPTTWTIRRHGKNYFDRNNVTFKIGYLLNTSGNESPNSSYMYSETYIPVLPNTEYIFSGIYPPGSTGTGAPVSCYRADKSFIERKISGTANNPHITTPADCYYIRFNCPSARQNGVAMYSGNKIASDVNIQIEVGATETDYEAYTQEDTTVTVTALNAPTAPTTLPTTALGENVFALFPTGALDNDTAISVTATMDLTVRLDPTLAYNSIKAAIVAAGSL